MLGKKMTKHSKDKFKYLLAEEPIRFCWLSILSLCLCYREAGGMRKGYMGHLTRIANTVVQNAEREQEQITQLIKGS